MLERICYFDAGIYPVDLPRIFSASLSHDVPSAKKETPRFVRGILRKSLGGCGPVEHAISPHLKKIICKSEEKHFFAECIVTALRVFKNHWKLLDKTVNMANIANENSDMSTALLVTIF